MLYRLLLPLLLLLPSILSAQHFAVIPIPQHTVAQPDQWIRLPWPLESGQIDRIHHEQLSDEGYRLDITPAGVRIETGSEAGFFYAMQTLKQLAWPEGDSCSLPVCRVEDAPAFEVRGFMLDVGRNFQSVEALKALIDKLAFYKMNVFHWHLTDHPAWRIESHLYPQLTAAENHRETRDPGLFYTYAQIREVMEFARERHVQVIPEIDMPGHSQSFITAMGVRMESPEGRRILEQVLTEFFTEIPAELAPRIHIGSDEVHIPDPEGFISQMVQICEAHQREVLIWNPGLPAADQVIRQTWQAKHLEKNNYREIDSWNSYVNNMEPMAMVPRLFFKPIGFESDNEVIGGILCLWPDVNIDQEREAFTNNPIYPALLAYANACWTGHRADPPEGYLTRMPDAETSHASDFADFEQMLMAHRDRFLQNEFFFYYPQSAYSWNIALKKPGEKLEPADWQPARGATLIFRDRFKLGGYFQDAVPGDTALATMHIPAEKDTTIRVLIGFETPLRANRTYGGMPDSGSWDAWGGQVWINQEELRAPAWEHAGWKPAKKEGWATAADQEIPWRAEELYWLRDPVEVSLKKGDNIIRFVAPYQHDYQNWMISFVVVSN